MPLAQSFCIGGINQRKFLSLQGKEEIKPLCPTNQTFIIAAASA
jgi:hypothetical protein